MAIDGDSAPSERIHAPLFLILAFLLIVVVLLVVGGLFVRSIVGASFRDVERIRAARVHVADMLTGQLDEETGVRGYAAARAAVLLAPYYDGRAKLPSSFARVRSDLYALNVKKALPELRDAININRRWLHQVAFPLILKKRVRRSVELHGKSFVDRFRFDATAIDNALARRGAQVNQRAQTAVAWVGGFALAAVVAVVLAAMLFTVAQYRLGVRLERQRAESEHERRKAAEVQAAYEAEKRIAEILQEAFSERLFPVLPAASFSATYVPASEHAKIGGDWYDALQLSEDRVLLAIGDVTGHGIEAVVAMNKARQLLIGCALLDATPARVLADLNFELVSAKSPIITAVSGVIDTRMREFAYASAGHPPPVLYEPGRRARLLDFGSLPLGVALKTEYRTHRVQTVPEAMIVLYTDGAIEHSRDLAQGEATLLEAVESAAQRPAADPAKMILDAIFSRRKVADDVAILAVRLSEATFMADIRTGKVSETGMAHPPRRIA